MLSAWRTRLYWMGRYLERAENITRLLLVTEDFSTDPGLAEDLAQTAWKDMLEIFPSAQLTERSSVRAAVGALTLYTFFTDQANGLLDQLPRIRKARENARLFAKP